MTTMSNIRLPMLLEVAVVEAKELQQTDPAFRETVVILQELLNTSGIGGKRSVSFCHTELTPALALSMHRDRPIELPTRSRGTLRDIGLSQNIPGWLDEMLANGVIVQPEAKLCGKVRSNKPIKINPRVRQAVLAAM